MGISGISKVTAEERAAHAALGERWCGRCERWLALQKFSPKKSTCKKCASEVSLASHYRHPETTQNRNRRKLYNLSPEEFEALRVRQGGVCAICKCVNGKGLAVDHDHATGKVRGLLCAGGCNPGLGYFKDNPDLLRAAADYLDLQRTDIYEFQVEGAAQ